MRAIRKVEKNLERFFKDAPKLPTNSRESLVRAMPWLAFVLGGLQTFAAWTLWHYLEVADRLETYRSLYIEPLDTPSGLSKLLILIGVAVLLVEAVLFLTASAHLKKRKQRGWDLFFAAVLLNVVYSALSLFMSGRGWWAFLVSLLGSMIGFYLLFQVRGKYKASGA
jgi:hypothetical protein